MTDLRAASADQFEIVWNDSGREPRAQPNPNYPKGIDVIAVPAGAQGCQVALPYPAKRIGSYFIECKVCGTTVLLTTAGRADDPRSVGMPCKAMRGSA